MLTTRRPAVLITAIAIGLASTTGAIAVVAGGSDEPAADRLDPSPPSVATGIDQPTAPAVTPSADDQPATSGVAPSADDESDTTAGDASAPDAPADPEPPMPGPSGVISGDEAATDPPQPTPLPGPSGPTELASVPPTPPTPPTTPSVPGPVDLVTPPMDPGPPPIDDFVTPTDPTPIDGPTDLRDTPLPDIVGTFTSEFSGCQLECITSALLSASSSTPDLRFDLAATVPVAIGIEVTEVGGDWTEIFANAGHDTAWSTTLGPLAADTTYDLTLRATDEDGHVKQYDHRFTTIATADGFVSDDVGCRLECITAGTATPGEAGNDVEVTVETHSPAALSVWLSTSEPTWVEDEVAKPAQGPVFEDDTPQTSWRFDVDGLEYDTTYHVVARATDAHGEHVRVGTFRTGADPLVDVLVRFEQMVVMHDGDPGRLDRGEIAFGWGFDGEGIGSRSEEKMHAGTVTIGANNARWFRVNPTVGSLPNPTAAAYERDRDGKVEFCDEGLGPGLEPTTIDTCDLRRNVAHHGGPISLDQIRDFPFCLDLGVPSGIGARCATFSSHVVGTRDDDFAHFSAIVSFSIDDETTA